MNGIIAALFVLVMFILTGIGMEYERADTTGWWDRATERNIDFTYEQLDSLWNIIQAFNILNENYYILPKKDFEKTTHDGFIKEGTEIYIKK